MESIADMEGRTKTQMEMQMGKNSRRHRWPRSWRASASQGQPWRMHWRRCRSWGWWGGEFAGSHANRHTFAVLSSLSGENHRLFLWFSCLQQLAEGRGRMRRLRPAWRAILRRSVACRLRQFPDAAGGPGAALPYHGKPCHAMPPALLQLLRPAACMKRPAVSCFCRRRPGATPPRPPRPRNPLAV